MTAGSDPQVPWIPSRPPNPKSEEAGAQVSRRDRYRAYGINGIGAAIRSARSETEFIPVGPEWRRLENLSKIWFVMIPVLVVLFDLTRRLVDHFVSLERLWQNTQTVLSEPNSDSMGLLIVVYVVPGGCWVLSIIVTAVLKAFEHFNPSGAYQKTLYFIPFGLAVSAVGISLIILYRIHASNPLWFWVIVWTCFYSSLFGLLGYWAVKFFTNATRSPTDYGFGIAVFTVSVLVVFFALIAWEAREEPVQDREAGEAILRGVTEPSSRTVGADPNGDGGDESDPFVTSSVGSESEDFDYWVIPVFFVSVALASGLGLWNYHQLQGWKLHGASHENQLSRLANEVVQKRGGLDAKSQAAVCQKIGKRLGHHLPRSLVIEYSVYVCCASGVSEKELSKSICSVDTGVSGAAISAGIQAVFNWAFENNHEWSSASYQFLCVQVSNGIAAYLYDEEFDRGKRWPFALDTDVLACSRLLAITVAEAIYLGKLHTAIRSHKQPKP